MPVRVEDIAIGVAPIGADMSASAALGLFLSDPSLFALPVVMNGAALGQVTRARLTEVLASPGGRDVAASRAVSHFMTPKPVMAETGTTVALIAKLAADGNTSVLTDGVIVLNDGRYKGLPRCRGAGERAQGPCHAGRRQTPPAGHGPGA